MEFIPLDKGKTKYSKRPREETREEEPEVRKSKRLAQNDGGKVSKATRLKQKPQAKGIQKKNVRNKYRENLAAKKKTKTSKKKTQKKIEKEKQKDEDEEDDVEEEEDESDVENEEKVENEEEEEEEDVEDEEETEDDDDGDEEEDKNSEEEAFRKKCKELDEKKKNRLFVKFPKKIHSEAQVKELHPDVRQVIFPRKKRTRWCWAVFASEEKADAAMKAILKTKDKKIFVNKPTPHDKVTLKLKEKMKTVVRKKEAKRKLQQMWT